MVKTEQTATSQPPDIFHVTRDEDYRRRLREEEAFWDGRAETLLSRTPRPAVQRYLNERMTGDPERRWYETISDHGDFRSGCVLGAGPGHVEELLLQRHEQLRLTVLDISTDALSRLQDRLDATFPGRAETRQEDLNFVSLDAAAYDLVVANSSIHHILNLEHLASAINQALTPEGLFFMEDTVGESFFQFSDEKKGLFETLVRATEGSGPRFAWPDRSRWPFSPFESARSGEILEVFARYLHEAQVRTAAALTALIIFAQRRKGRRERIMQAVLGQVVRRRIDAKQGRARGELLFALDALACDSGYLRPGLAFAIYRKRGRA